MIIPVCGPQPTLTTANPESSTISAVAVMGLGTTRDLPWAQLRKLQVWRSGRGGRGLIGLDLIVSFLRRSPE